MTELTFLQVSFFTSLNVFIKGNNFLRKFSYINAMMMLKLIVKKLLFYIE